MLARQVIQVVSLSFSHPDFAFDVLGYPTASDIFSHAASNMSVPVMGMMRNIFSLFGPRVLCRKTPGDFPAESYGTVSATTFTTMSPKLELSAWTGVSSDSGKSLGYSELALLEGIVALSAIYPG